MQISNKYIAIEKVVEEEKEGFQAVQVQDSSTFKGRVIMIPECPVFMGNKQVAPGDIIYYAKNSPDTHEIEHDGKKIKFVAVADLLSVL